MKLFRFPDIEQLRNAIRTVKDRCEYHKLPLPTLTFKGTVKLHGTNAGVVKDLTTGEIWVQSRGQIITPTDDNEGFAKFVAANSIVFQTMFKTAQDLYQPGDDQAKPTHIAIFGEWCGKGIMKGVAINQLDRRFVQFGIRAIVDQEDPIMNWMSPAIQAEVVKQGNGADVYCIHNFPTYEVEVDFSKPEIAQNEFVRITNEVEAECPVGKFFIANEVNGCEVSMENGKLISNKKIPSIVEIEVKKLLLTFPESTKLVLSI